MTKQIGPSNEVTVFIKWRKAGFYGTSKIKLKVVQHWASIEVDPITSHFGSPAVILFPTMAYTKKHMLSKWLKIQLTIEAEFK